MRAPRRIHGKPRHVCATQASLLLGRRSGALSGPHARTARFRCAAHQLVANSAAHLGRLAALSATTVLVRIAAVRIIAARLACLAASKFAAWRGAANSLTRGAVVEGAPGSPPRRPEGSGNPA